MNWYRFWNSPGDSRAQDVNEPSSQVGEVVFP